MDGQEHAAGHRDNGAAAQREMTRSRPPVEFAGLERPLVVLDSEWTCGSRKNAEIVSVALTRYEPNGSQSAHYWVVRPYRRIDPAASEVHGLTDADVAERPRLEEVAEDIRAVLEGCDLAGYGVVGDIEVIERELARAGAPWSPDGAAIIDGLRLWQRRERRRLEDAYRKFVGPVPEDIRAHDAACDVEMTAAVIAALRDGKSMRELHAEGNEDMVDVAGKFKRDHGDVVFNFGDYRGAVAASEPRYLEWMLGKDFPESTLAIARKLLDEAYASNADEIGAEVQDEQRDERRDLDADPASDVPF